MKSPVKNWTDAKWRSWVVSLLRRGTMKFPPRNEALRAAKTEKKINEKTGRMAQHYRCAECLQEFPAKGVCADHIQPVIDPNGSFVDWNTYIERMFCPVENLQILCFACHDLKSSAERIKRKTNEDYRNRKRKY